MPKLTGRPRRKSRKLTLTLSEREYELVGKLAQDSEKDMSEVLRGALKMRGYLESKTVDGTEVVLKRDKEFTVVPLELFR